MTVRDYKITPRHSRKPLSSALLLVLFLISHPIWAGQREEDLTLSALKEVDAVALRSSSLDAFGKATLSQSTVILDLGSQAQAPLLRFLNDRQQDWMTRYWVADMLGYIGDQSALEGLLQVVRKRGENAQIRMRCLDSIEGISARGKNRREISRRLKLSLKQVENAQVRKKVKEVLRKL